jgi:hypothetical protein
MEWICPALNLEISIKCKGISISKYKIEEVYPNGIDV